MVKRTANTELNHDNWDEDVEVEERGSFIKASDEVLKTRVIKTARRRNPLLATSAPSPAAVVSTDEGDQPVTKNIFGSFTGFKKPDTSSLNAFSFLQNICSPKANETEKTNISNTTPNLTFGSTTPITNNTKNTNKQNQQDNMDDTEYLAKLKGLNESVSKWIQQHVSSNPLCNLSPIFRDYEKYFKEIESAMKQSDDSADKDSAKKNAPDKSSTPILNIFGNTNAPNVNPFTNKSPQKPEPFGGFKFQSSTTPSNEKASPATAKVSGFGTTTSVEPKNEAPNLGFTFGTTPTTFKQSSSLEVAPEVPKTSGFSFSSTQTGTFTFGSSATTNNTAGKGFSFGNSSSTPFQFKNVAAPTDAPASDTITIEDDVDEPPKVEFTPVVEEDHVYSQRCKVFAKREGNFVERGVGQLFLKPIPNKDKYQLIVRADTNLGNLLVNTILSESIPMQRMGKNNVMIVCRPLPDDKKTTPLLLRVKTAEDADKMLEILNKYKN